MARRLIVLEEPMPPREVVPGDDALEIGRAPGSGLALMDSSVSRCHALIRRQGEDLVIVDRGSTFGTFVNDELLRPGASIVLRDGDVIRLGKVRMVCRFDEEVGDAEAEARDARFAAQANARLLIQEEGKVRRCPIAWPATLLGAGLHCAVRLEDESGPPEEALIRAAGGRFRLEARSSSHLPRLDDMQVRPGEPVVLLPGSVMLLHRAQVLFLYDFDGEGRPVPDPLAGISRSRLLRSVSRQTGLSRELLKGLCRDRGESGMILGEILVERGLITPLFWRAICRRILARQTMTLRASLRRLIPFTRED